MIWQLVTVLVVSVAVVQAKNLDTKHRFESNRANYGTAPNTRPHRKHSTAFRTEEPKLTFRDNIEHYGMQFSQNTRNFRLPKPIAYEYRDHHLAKRSLDSDWHDQTSETSECDIAPIQPEVLLLLDHGLYKKHGNRTGEFGKSFVNAMNKVLEAIPCPKITLHLSNIAYNEDSQMPFIENNMIAPGKVNINGALMDLSRFLYKINYVLPTFDLVMQLVDSELCQTSIYSRDLNCRIYGMTFSEGACWFSDWQQQILSTMVVRESGGYDGVKVAIHELLHLMSATHDDNPFDASKTSGCPSSDNFIMSNGGSNVNDILRKTNQFKLSPCTIAEIRSFMQKSSSKCLLNDPPANFALSSDDYYILSGDEQCRLRYGNGSTLCNLSCAALGCTNDNICSHINPPMEGTPCDNGNGKCRLGECESSVSLEAETLATAPLSLSFYPEYYQH